MQRMLRSALTLLFAAPALFAGPGVHAQIAVSANDNKATLVNGVGTVVANPAPDSITIIDLNGKTPRVITELIDVPTSAVGPPMAVAIAPDESIALVTRASKIDPADPTKVIADDTLSVIDLKADKPSVIATLKAGLGAAGVSFNKQGTLALVANRNEGTVSVFTVAGRTLSAAGKVKLGEATSGPCHVVITPDGKTALVTRDGDNTLSLLTIDGDKVEVAKRDFASGIRPYGADMSPDGRFAVVANVGKNQGDIDTISLVDMQAKPVRVVETVVAAPTPEGIQISPDGKFVAVIAHNGSGKAKDSPFYNEHGLLILFRVDGMKLVRVADAPIGHWSQGIAFSKDGRTILAQNMLEHDIQVFHFDGKRLTDTGQPIKVSGQAAAIRTAKY